MELAVSPDLAARLRTAAAARRWIHHVDCATYGEDGQRADCDCAVPDLLGDLLMLLGPAVEAAVTQAQRAA